MANCSDINNTTVYGTDIVTYDGPPLPCSDINTCDNLNVALEKLDTVICEINSDVSNLTNEIGSVTEDVLDISNNITNILNQLNFCCPTTTTTSTSSSTTTTTSTTTKLPCLDYFIQALQDNAIWNGIDCSGQPIGGILSNAGDIVSSTCLEAASITGEGINVLIGIECTTTTTTTTVACNCVNIIISQDDIDDSTGNTFPYPGSVVLMLSAKGITCEGGDLPGAYNVAGTYKYCLKPELISSITFSYWKNNVAVTTVDSEAVNLGTNCLVNSGCGTTTTTSTSSTSTTTSTSTSTTTSTTTAAPTTTTTSSTSTTTTSTSSTSTTTSTSTSSTTTTTTTEPPTTTTTTTFGACTEFIADGSSEGGTVDYIDCDSNPVSLPVALGEISAPFCGLLGSITTDGPTVSIEGPCSI